MYDSGSCSYSGALDLKGASGTTGSTATGVSVASPGVKQENWPYRGLACGSTFQQLKQSVEKAKQALADRGGYLAGAFSPPPRVNPSTISPTATITVGDYGKMVIVMVMLVAVRVDDGGHRVCVYIQSSQYHQHSASLYRTQHPGYGYPCIER
ncbi:hypothetical protein KQX54_019917 [Cotesia glomerata]|uniref:Uncharacterized protein n=1 Tax=Cotesia glomerata TaxID=32391 RepID=A0AAV7HW21_COTGL|nr:hypothetical protein KQX54_019917 [Cotesia glomerata]